MEYYNELYHHGVKGMKWGIRRYQNKDGSLTPAGKKKYAKLEAELDKLGGKGKSEYTYGTPTKKIVSEMSDDELKTYTNRMRLEKEYYEAGKNLAAVNPVRVSKGRQFANKFVKEAIEPAVVSVGKSYLEDFMKKKLNLKGTKEMSWDDKLKKQTYEKNQRQQAFDDLELELKMLKKQADIDAHKKKQGGS